MKQFIAFITLAVTLVSGAHIRYGRDSGSYAEAGANSRSGVTMVDAAEPIAIVRSVFNGPTGDNPDFDFSYEAENGIKQEATGTMKEIDGAEVMIMRGSYSYIDANGAEVLVSWEADENGYRAESDILPVAPEIPFEAQAIAVAAQIRFAQEELARNTDSATAQDNYSAASSEQSQRVSAKTLPIYRPPPTLPPTPFRAAEDNYSAASSEESQRVSANFVRSYGAPIQPFRATAPASNGFSSGNTIEDLPNYEVQPVIQEVRFVEVAQPLPAYAYDELEEEARVVEAEPVNQSQVQSQPNDEAQNNQNGNGRSSSTFGNERVAPVQAKSRSQPAYIQYLLE